MVRGDKVSPAMEDYLEAILHFAEKDGHARVRDIAARVGVKRPTVSAALRSLSLQEMVNYTPYEVVTLTARGSAVAERVRRRHDLLSRFLQDVLGVSAETADGDACRLEHGLSRESVTRLVAFMEFTELCPKAKSGWLGKIGSGCARAASEEKECRTCVGSDLDALEELGNGAGSDKR